jgi:hypothetical protein
MFSSWARWRRTMRFEFIETDSAARVRIDFAEDLLSALRILLPARPGFELIEAYRAIIV